VAATTIAPPIVASAKPADVPAVDAKAFAVFDPRTGELLAGRDIDRQLPVGSVIKLLTAYVAYAAGKPHKIVTAPEQLLISYEESAIGVYPGEQLPRDLLIRALLIVSANDAARALAVDIAGSEDAFAGEMTAAATALGLTNTRAANATGLDADGQYSSASDVVRLGALLMKDATFRETVARPDASLHDLTLPATNDWKPLYPGANGIKTGHTTDAGFCIVASAARDGRELIVAVLGAPTEAARNAGATALLDWAFSR
jgi:D-alanyl-D-alanine carboxypeptidase (penicillin-binding protein 5/6)